MTPPLSRPELKTLREKASSGLALSLDEIRQFVASIRKSWSAIPKEKTEGKSRVKKAPPTEDDVTFF